MQAVLGAASAGVIAISSYLGGGHKIPTLYNRAVPSVVYIESRGSTRNPLDVDGERIKVVQGIGSGFVVKKIGVVSPVKVEVVTNYHVVADSEKIKVVFNRGGEGVDAELIAADFVNDLALLEIEMDKGVAPLKLCPVDVDREIGEPVVAIGNPFGLEGSLSEGIVSGKDREIGTGEGLLQTDAAINPGNSGGPLISVDDGCVIGVNTATIGGASSIGFAVPVDRIVELMAGS